MISIDLESIGKRFQYEWIFRNLNFQFSHTSKTAIVGSNGSGKSTLLRCLSGSQVLTEGKLQYFLNGKEISHDNIFRNLVITAPYLELPEEFSLLELLKFHFKFKNLIPEMDFSEMMKLMYLEEHQNKSISFFSSGMKQRLKLGLCFFSDVPLLLLDEPTSNLDQRGVNWYLDLVQKFSGDKTIIVCSNDSREYSFCDKIINIEDFKVKQKL